MVQIGAVLFFLSLIGVLIILLDSSKGKDKHIK
jgi:hypothetical protein